MLLFSVLMPPSVTALKNGHVMTMAMVSARSIPTPWKGCGLAYALFYVLFAAFINAT
jgi:hypothetical protein